MTRREQEVVAEMCIGDLLALYKRVWGGYGGLGLHSHSTARVFVVRQWDGMGGGWCDCAPSPLSALEALQLWAERTENGTKCCSFEDIDYYKIFDVNSCMLYDVTNPMFDDGDDE